MALHLSSNIERMCCCYDSRYNCHWYLLVTGDVMKDVSSKLLQKIPPTSGHVMRDFKWRSEWHCEEFGLWQKTIWQISKRLKKTKNFWHEFWTNTTERLTSSSSLAELRSSGSFTKHFDIKLLKSLDLCTQ